MIMNEKMMIAFGQYLLSEKRKARYKAIKMKGFTLKQRLSEVNDADIRNFMSEYQP